MDDKTIKEQISSLESYLRLDFSDGYKEFLLSRQQSNYIRKGFIIKGINDESVVSKFLDIGSESNVYSVIQILKTYDGLYEKKLIPFAVDVFGNFICLLLSEINYGKVYFVSHGIDVREGFDFENNEVSPDFESFISSLEDIDYEDEYVDDLTQIIRDGKKKLLIKKLNEGLDPNTINESNRSILEEALFAEKHDIVSLLIEYGADFEQFFPKMTGFLNKPLLIQIYSSFKAPNLLYNGMNPIMFAFLRDKYSLIKELVKLGVSIDHSNPKWEEIIRRSISMNKTEGIDFLRQNGFEIS